MASCVGIMCETEKRNIVNTIFVTRNLSLRKECVMDSDLTMDRIQAEEQCGCGCASLHHADHSPLGIASVPCQKWGETYELAKALKVGTIFAELDMPFFMGGDKNVQ